MYSELI